MAEFERPIASVDAALFTLRNGELHVVLVKRDKDPWGGRLALPGGFVHAEDDDDTEATAKRMLKEKTQISVPYLEQLYTFSGKFRDPRGWSISVAYFALVSENELSGGTFEVVPVDRCPRLPFDHNKIVEMGVARLRGKATYSALPAYLLGDEFTLFQLQAVYEAVLGVTLSRFKFRRIVLEQGIVEEIPGKMQHGSNRPAQLYRLAPDHLRAFGRQLHEL